EVPHLTKRLIPAAPAIAAVRHPASAACERELDATTATAPSRDPGSLPPSWHRGGRYCLIGQSQEAGNAVKLLRLARRSRASPMQSSAPNSGLRLHNVLAGQRRTRWQLALLSEEQGQAAPGWWTRRGSWLFRETEASSCASALRSCRWLAVENPNISLSYRFALYVRAQEIPFAHVWSGGQAGLHCAFGLEHVDRLRQSVSCKIVVYQNHYYNSRQVVHIVQQARTIQLPAARFEFRCARPTSSAGLKSSWNSRADPPQTVFKTPAQTPWRHLSITRRAQLPRQRLADAWSPAWHGAAGWAAGGRPSPTDCLLDLWEAAAAGARRL
uniref:UPA domain-containing protein n=1 Tax=Macrostomum lignano TaxID=282301 RepID=A0A1I8JR62_9PLAT